MRGRCLGLMMTGLLVAASGCTHTSPLRRPEAKPEAPPAGSPAAAADVMQHKAPTHVAYGDLRAALAVAPEKADHERHQALEDAKSNYRKAIELDPRYEPAYTSLARLQQSVQDYAGAEQTYAMALKLAPQNPALWYDLGLCQCRQKQWVAGVESLKKACELNPSNRSYHTSLGYTLGRAGRVQESLAVLSAINGEAKANFDLARLMLHMNEQTTARQLAATAVALDPALPGARQLLADLNGKPRQPVIHSAASARENDKSAEQATVPTIIQATSSTNVAETTKPAAAEATVIANQDEPTQAKSIRMPPLPVIISGKK